MNFSSELTGELKTNALLDELLCCPACKGPLGSEACTSCGQRYSRVGRQVRFVEASFNTPDADFQDQTQNNKGFTAQIFNLGKKIISSEFEPNANLKKYLTKAEGVVVELGSGSRRLRPDIVTVDLFPSRNVEVVADITQVPMKSSSVDCVILDSVIEHVADPVAVIEEARRILRPGGSIFINCPFMLPYHGYPKHFQNFTRDGLEHLLREFSTCEVRPTFGPMTAWVNMTAETFGVMVGGERGLTYVVAKGLALLPIFWLKYLDILFVRSPRAHRISGMLCAIGIK